MELCMMWEVQQVHYMYTAGQQSKETIQCFPDESFYMQQETFLQKFTHTIYTNIHKDIYTFTVNVSLFKEELIFVSYASEEPLKR